MNIKRLAPLLACIALSGCAGMELNPYKDLSTMGKVWQAGHVIDLAQTLEIVNDPCYKEGRKETAFYIGEQPSKARVLLWGAGSSYLNAQIDQAVERSDLPEWGKTTIRAFQIGVKYNDVFNNHEIGIRIGTNNKPDPNLCRY